MTVLGVDIGGTSVKAGLVDESGRVIEQQSQPTPHSSGDFRQLLRALAARWAGRFDAAGFGCKGLIDAASTRVIRSPGPVAFLEGLSLSEMAGLNVPARAGNDAHAAMAGEMRWGAARGHRHALLFTLGSGVGGAIVADGRLLGGVSGIAGHLGHVTVDPWGACCICGNRGCLETVFSARALEAEVWRVVNAGCATKLAGGPVTCEALFEAAAGGDRAATVILDKAVYQLAAAIAGLLFAFDPEVVILGGNIARAGVLLWRPLAAGIHERTRAFLGREVPLVPQQTSDPSGIAGAAALAMAGI